MIDVDTFLDRLRERLEAGALEYGNRSFLRQPAELVDEVVQELLDVVGWVYILWAKVDRKLRGAQPEQTQRGAFLYQLRHRLARRDRGVPQGQHLEAALVDLEVLAIDAFETAQRVEERLQAVARALEVAPDFTPSRGRRGGAGTSRSGD